MLLYGVGYNCRERQKFHQMEGMYVTCKLLRSAVGSKEQAFVPPPLVCFDTLYGIHKHLVGEVHEKQEAYDPSIKNVF